MSAASSATREANPAPPRDVARELIAAHFGNDAGVLTIAGTPVTELVADHGAPLFCYSAEVAAARLEAVRSVLPGGFDVYYSIKANPHPAFLKFFLSRGCGLEVASAGELSRVLEAGCSPERILFAGPGKSDAELTAAVEAGIGEIHVESIGEIRRLAAIAADADHEVAISLRINPEAAAAGGAMRMGGKPAPFGIDEECLEEAVAAAMAESSLRVVGLHLFAGTQILSHETLLAQYRHGLNIARRMAAQIGRPLETIDLGGGWGVPYFPHEQPLNLESLRQELAVLGGELRSDPALAQARVVLEPGRFLTAECGVYVAQVIDVKQSRGTTFAITNGGMHHHLAASGNLGQTIKRNFPIVVANRLDESATITADVVGPLCTPLDVLGRKVSIPEVKPGDLIAVFQSGAYARTASPNEFLSHPLPAEVWIEKNSAWGAASSENG